MNFETLKSEFREYLKQNAKKKKVKYKLNDSQKSIFLYSKEFKAYLEDKLDIDISDLTKSAKDLSKFELVDGILVNKDLKDDIDEAELTDFDEIELDDPEILVAILNDLLQDEDFKKVLDRNEDGEIDEDELNDFYGSIEENDEDEKTVSLEDIIGALNDINNGEFKFSDEIDKEKELEAERLSNGGGSISSGNYSSNANKKQGANGDITKMSKNELKSELETNESELGDAQDELVENQSLLTAVLNGTDSELQDAQKEVDAVYNEYQESLEKADKELLGKIDDKKTEIDDKNKLIAENEAATSQQQTLIQLCEESANAAKSKISSLNQIKTNLESALASADDSRKADISSKISEVESQIEAAEKEAEEAQIQLEEAQKEFDKLSEEKTSLDNELSVLELDLEKLQETATKKYPQTEKSLQNYKDAQNNYDTLKETKANSLKQELDASMKKVADINDKNTQIQNLINQKEYSANTSGETAAQFAESFMGYNEHDGSADIFVEERNTNSKKQAWCAAFVNYVLKNSGEWENVPEWYKECPNPWLSASIYKTAKEHDAVINTSDAQPGDVVVFNFNGKISHTGLVYKVDDDGTLYTIEGNAGNGEVLSNAYSINDERLFVCKTTD